MVFFLGLIRLGTESLPFRVMKLQSGLLFLLLCSLFLVSCAEQGGDDGAAEQAVTKEKSKFPEVSVSEARQDTPPPPSGKITVISIDRLFGLKQNGEVLLIDCRKAFFHRMGSIDGSVNISAHQFKSDFSAVKPQLDAAVKADQIIVLYCLNPKCPIAYNVAQKLSQRGYAVTIYEGGWEEWKSVGLE